MKPRILLVGILFLLLVGLVFLWKQRGTEPAAASAESPVESANTAATEAVAPLKARSTETIRSDRAAEEMNHLQVMVHDPNGRPIESAEVRSSIRVSRGEAPLTNYNGTFKTTAHGIADVTWPRAKMASFKITASKDEFAARQMTWDLTAGDSIPPVYTITLTNGITLGGFVVDPEGSSIVGANISLYRFWQGDDPRPTKGEDSGFSSQKLQTGNDGRWLAHSIPGDLLKNISVEITHTDFLSTNFNVRRQAETEAALRAGIHRVVLQRGLLVRGRVIDEAQQPITNAQVWAGRKYFRERKETRSDAEGRFLFKNISEGSTLFSVMAEGFAPDFKTHRGDANAGELVFQLRKGAVIRGIVQNEDAEPLKGVRVVLEGGPGDPAYDHYEFSTTTDADGRFEWKSAPDKSMPFYIGAADYEQKRGVPLKPNEQNVVTLNRNRVVHGQVLDADTGQPVKRFKVLPGESYSENSLGGYSSSDTREISNEDGRFTLELHEQRANAIEVTAQSYFERLEKLPKAENGRIDVTVQLKPSKPLEGVVLTPEGQPVPGAAVGISEANARRGLTFAKGELRPNGRSKTVTADTAGRFSISPAPEEGTVVAVVSNRFGSATVAQVRASGSVKLESFGRIEGVLLRGGESAAGQELLLSAPPATGLYFEFEGYKTTTDAEGRFSFENVPPGKVGIVRLVKTSARSWMHSHRTEATVLAGQTTTVTLGGTEATLRGRVRFDGDAPAGEFIMSAQLSTVPPKAPSGLTAEQRTEYYKSAEWQDYTKNAKHYSAVVNQDGSVILDSVVPGQYTLRVTATEPDNDSFGRQPLARGEASITVPAGVSPNAPIEVGEVLMKRTQPATSASPKL